MKPIHITFGIISFLGIIFVSNVAVYDTLVKLFNFHFSLAFLQIFLAVLSLGFIGAFMLGRRHYGLFSKTFFVLTAYWMGFLIYISLASFLYLSIYSITRKDNIFLGEILVILPLLFWIYGIINARIIAIRKFNIQLSNLPEKWQGKKAVWISDVHIGLVYQKKHVERIAKKIMELAPDIVFIGGDLFDGISAPPILELANPLAEVKAPLGVYFVSGNHEHYGVFADFINKIESLGIKILKNEVLIIDGLQILGVEYEKHMKRHYYRKLLSDLDINKDIPSILLRHEPRDLKIAEQAGINFQISGHTHNAQQWPLNYYAKLTYGKYVYGLKHHGKMIMYTSSGAGTWGPAIRVGSRNEIVEFTFV